MALLVGVALSWQIARLETERVRSDLRGRIVADLATIRAKTEGTFRAAFSATGSLSNLIAFQGGIPSPVFHSVASQLLHEHPVLRNMALAPDDVVTAVYPLHGNEAALGLRYAALPEQWATVQQARQLRHAVLAGPVDLVQGGRGLIIRTPVFLTRERDAAGRGRYWGTLATVIKLDALLEDSGISTAQTLEIALRGKDAQGKEGALIFGSPEIFMDDPVLMDIAVPGGNWQLAAIPNGGWAKAPALSSPYFLIGCVNSILLAGLIGMLVLRRELARQRNDELLSEIEERRQTEHALGESEERFRQMFEFSPDPAWLIEDGRFSSCNSRAAEVLGFVRPTELLGMTALQLSPSEQPDGESSAARMQRMMGLARLQGTHRFEWVFRQRSGRTFPAELTMSSVMLQGRPVLYCVWRDISALKRTQAELVQMAHYDALTGLPNRLLFMDRLDRAVDRARRNEYQVAVLLLDLDGFKTVNDSLGHPVGDKLLAMVADRLKANVRVEDTVARLGGDEFAVVLGGLADGNDAIEVVRKIIESIDVPFNIEGDAALVTTSIGIAVYPGDGTQRDELIRNADAAMYGAKAAGRNTYRFYQSSMTLEAQERLYLEQGLRRAIREGELEVWYQPQIRIADGVCVGAEALVRWRDPNKGLIPPVEFIPMAERTGLIVAVGERVIDLAGAAMQRWRRMGLDFGPLSINVAGAQIVRSDFVSAIESCLQRYALPAAAFSIEVTETLLMEHMERAIDVLDAIKALGISTAIDDFGTGYSSLVYLKRLPIDTLKIDRAFVHDIPHDPYDQAITRTIIAMGHTLGFSVIAEGVENEQQLAFLRAEGCDMGQGYLFARPLPEAEFEAWLRSRIDAAA
ncbi:MAG TPA: EAL domain-containing protein [Rhodocyclaceae bacterium]|nr:EAL domain-containing protein [Rhodocyclaceae bacterium]